MYHGCFDAFCQWCIIIVFEKRFNLEQIHYVIMLDRAAVFITYNTGQKYAVLVRVLLDLKMLKF